MDKPSLKSILIVILILFQLQCFAQQPLINKLKFIDHYYENASPLFWDAVGDTAVKISLLYDYENNSVNRQCTHFNFKIIAERGTELNLIISGFRNIYNGRVQPKYGRTGQAVAVFFSEDYQNWKGMASAKVKENDYDMQVKYLMNSDTVYVASLPVYSLSHLEILKNRIAPNPLIKIFEIGKTVKKRPLEIIRLGNPTAERIVLVRGRAHAWEPGGNWAIEGLIDSYLERAKNSDIVDNICYYILPMANKDMVARGMTRFNIRGMDLNRGWGYLADSELAPENYYLEKFLVTLINQNSKPDFFIDFHNDNYGNLHVPHPKIDDKYFLPKIERFFNLLNEHTWFCSKLQHGKSDDPSRYNSATGLYHRFDIPGIIFELNGDRIDKLDKIPEISDWKEMGNKLNDVFEAYFIRL